MENTSICLEILSTNQCLICDCLFNNSDKVSSINIDSFVSVLCTHLSPKFLCPTTVDNIDIPQFFLSFCPECIFSISKLVEMDENFIKIQKEIQEFLDTFSNDVSNRRQKVTSKETERLTCRNADEQFNLLETNHLCQNALEPGALENKETVDIFIENEVVEDLNSHASSRDEDFQLKDLRIYLERMDNISEILSKNCIKLRLSPHEAIQSNSPTPSANDEDVTFSNVETEELNLNCNIGEVCAVSNDEERDSISEIEDYENPSTNSCSGNFQLKDFNISLERVNSIEEIPADDSTNVSFSANKAIQSSPATPNSVQDLTLGITQLDEPKLADEESFCDIVEISVCDEGEERDSISESEEYENLSNSNLQTNDSQRFVNFQLKDFSICVQRIDNIKRLSSSSFDTNVSTSPISPVAMVDETDVVDDESTENCRATSDEKLCNDSECTMVEEHDTSSVNYKVESSTTTFKTEDNSETELTKKPLPELQEFSILLERIIVATVTETMSDSENSAEIDDDFLESTYNYSDSENMEIEKKIEEFLPNDMDLEFDSYNATSGIKQEVCESNNNSNVVDSNLAESDLESNNTAEEISENTSTENDSSNTELSGLDGRIKRKAAMKANAHILKHSKFTSDDKRSKNVSENSNYEESSDDHTDDEEIQENYSEKVIKVNKNSQVSPKYFAKANISKAIQRKPCRQWRCRLKRCRCLLCEEIFPSSMDLRHHLKSHHRNLPYKCQHCHANIGEFVEDYNKHMRQSKCLGKILGKNEEIFNCNDCEKTFPAKHLILRHRCLCHNQNVCEICGNKPKTFRHFLLHTKEIGCVCDICGKPIMLYEDLEPHRFTHMGDSQTFGFLLNVQECDGAFTSQKEFQHHLKFRHGVIPYDCQNCQEIKEVSVLDYKSHMRRTNCLQKLLGLKEETFDCRDCDRVFYAKYLLMEHHSRMHNNNKCELCGAAPKKLAHFLKHTEEIPCVCDICGMPVRQFEDLELHRYTHIANNKSLICLSSNFKFFRRNVVNNNQKSVVKEVNISVSKDASDGKVVLSSAKHISENEQAVMIESLDTSNDEIIITGITLNAVMEQASNTENSTETNDDILEGKLNDSDSENVEVEEKIEVEEFVRADCVSLSNEHPELDRYNAVNGIIREIDENSEELSNDMAENGLQLKCAAEDISSNKVTHSSNTQFSGLVGRIKRKAAIKANANILKLDKLTGNADKSKNLSGEESNYEISSEEHTDDEEIQENYSEKVVKRNKNSQTSIKAEFLATFKTTKATHNKSCPNFHLKGNRHRRFPSTKKTTKTNQGSIPYKCQYCHANIGEFVKDYFLHMRNSKCLGKILGQKEETFNCSDCEKVFSAKYLLLRHRCYCHNNRVCEICSSKSCSFRHFLQHTKETGCVCDICGKPVMLYEQLEPHRLTHMGNSQFCKNSLNLDENSKCEGTFTSQKEFQQHLKIRHVVIPYDCQNCQEIKEVSVLDYKSHMRRTNCLQKMLGLKEETFDCLDCDRVFYAKYILMEHRSRMHKNNKCEICGSAPKNFPHFLNHTGEMACICDICGMPLQRFEDLEPHRYSHISQYESLVCFASEFIISRRCIRNQILSPTQVNKNLTNGGVAHSSAKQISESEEATITGSLDASNNETNRVIPKEVIPASKRTLKRKAALKANDIISTVTQRRKSARNSVIDNCPTSDYEPERESGESSSSDDALDENDEESGNVLGESVVRKRKLLSTLRSRPSRYQNFNENRISFKDRHKMISDIGKDEIPYECQVCHEKFNVCIDYENHARVSKCRLPSDVTENRFRCDKCGQIFKAKYLLLHHSAIRHNTTKCSVCDKSSIYYDHFLEHTEEICCICDICGMPLSQFADLQPHRLSHLAIKDKHLITQFGKPEMAEEKEIPIECKSCLKKFKEVKNYFLHVRTSWCPPIPDGTITVEKCDKCEKTFKAKYLLMEHRFSKHLSKKCEICNKHSNMKGREKLNHFLNHTGEVPFYCDICEKPCHKFGNFVAHRLTHMSKKISYSCEYEGCAKVYSNLYNLKSHMNMHRNLESGSELCCVICQKEFTVLSSFKAHMKSHQKRYLCNFCGKMFSSKEKLKLHSQSHTGYRYSCTMCEKKFKTAPLLKIHYQLIHLKVPNIKKYACDLCDKRFLTNVLKNDHMRCLHTGEKPFKCTICEDSFHTRLRLKAHSQTRHPTQKFECEICKKCFPRKINLDNHRKIHLGKTFKCDTCPKSFAYCQNLITHKRSHTGVKPYQCDECGKIFTRKDNLNTHVRMHAKDKQGSHKCKTCGDSFANKKNLTAHMKSIHNIKSYTSKKSADSETEPDSSTDEESEDDESS